MVDETTLVHAKVGPDQRDWMTSRPLRFYFFLTGVLFPIVCFAAALAGFGVTDRQAWQSGQPSDYAAMLFEWPAIAVFWPLLLFSIVGLSYWILRPNDEQPDWVLFAISTGLVLSTQYFILVLMTSSIATLVFAAFGFIPLVLFVLLIDRVLLANLQRYSLQYLFALTAACAVAMAILRASDVAFSPFVELLVGLIVGPSPSLAPLTYLVVSCHILTRPKEDSFRDQVQRSVVVKLVAALLAWLGAWGASWKLALEMMMEQYAQLPTQDPNCYVSSAAATGHAWLVRGHVVEGCASGCAKNVSQPSTKVAVVNRQMKQLKFLEFAVAAAAPNAHRRLRGIYDRIGPTLAAGCRRSRWFADVSFLLLQPFALLAEFIRWSGRIPRERIERIYTRRSAP